MSAAAGQFTQQTVKPLTVRAVRYRFGGPLDELRTLARLEHSGADVVEVPEWRSLLVRDRDDDDDPDYEVVPDGGWLVLNVDLGGYLTAWDDERFTAAYQPATEKVKAEPR